MRALDEATFDEALEQAEGLLLIDFWADWCGPCKHVGPILEGLEPAYEGRVSFCTVNADENPRLMNAFGVRSIPTVILLRPNPDGPGAKVLGHSVGAKSPTAFAQLIDKALAPKAGFLARLGGLFRRDD